MSQEQVISIFVLPTEEGQPPRAILANGEIVRRAMLTGSIVTWSRDLGAWVSTEGMPLPPDLGDDITEHAKSLGVEW